MRSLMMAVNAEDRRDRVPHADDDPGDGISVMPFASLLRRLH